jgi:hypothetical protein
VSEMLNYVNAEQSKTQFITIKQNMYFKDQRS